jgi:hypothetical protein
VNARPTGGQLVRDGAADHTGADDDDVHVMILVGSGQWAVGGVQ